MPAGPKRRLIVVSVALSCSVLLVTTAGLRRAASSPRSPLILTAAALSAVPVSHVIEIMLENHTFDSLFAHFKGADGMPAGQSFPNPNEYFTSMPRIPPVVAPPNEGDVYGGINNSRAAEKMAMDYVPGRGYLMDLYTLFPSDGLSAVTELGPQMDPDLQYLAHHYELADMNFQPAIAPTQPNVDYALAATGNGWMYNNTPPASQDHWSSIFDELSRANRSWRIYYGIPPSLLQGTVWEQLIPPGSSSDLAPASQFFSDLSDGNLPDFSLVRPGVGYSEEPPEDVGEGDAWLGQLVGAVAKSPYWDSTAIFITYDEGGGFYDHVAPPVKSSFGYGTRTPMVIVSPWVRQGVFGEQTTNISILSFMQKLWRLAPLTALNAAQNDLYSAFDFKRKPLPAPKPPVAPAYTIGFYGANTLADVPTPAPGSSVTVNLELNTPGLALDAAASGVLKLTCISPKGDRVPRGFPADLRLAGGKASFTTSFARGGFYRIEARGPAGSLGWVTLDVGAGPDST